MTQGAITAQTSGLPAQAPLAGGELKASTLAAWLCSLDSGSLTGPKLKEQTPSLVWGEVKVSRNYSHHEVVSVTGDEHGTASQRLIGT